MELSKIVISRETGLAVAELYSQAAIDAVNLEKYYLMGAYDYLCQFNEKLKKVVDTPN